MKILVTGANGFIGSAIINSLSNNNNIHIIAALRKNSNIIVNKSNVSIILIEDINKHTNWYKALEGVTTVIHTAGVAHKSSKLVKNEIYREVNYYGTLNLAEQAISSGVKRFIFLSSIKVNGEVTEFNVPFNAEDTPLPIDYYGISKLEAEKALFVLSKITNLEIVIIRPPLVYGNGSKGNISVIEKCVALGLPLPFASISNKRSVVSINNLINLIQICLYNSNAINQIFLVSDNQDLNISDLIRLVVKKNIRKPIIFPFPVKYLKFLFSLFGKSKIYNKICCNLQVDIEKTKKLLSWNPE
jgi:UDP-glucose 4-epimerase